MDAEPGSPYTEEVRSELEKDLRRLGLFDRVTVRPDPADVQGESTVVEVELRERWTLVPIPFFTTGSGGSSGGLFVIENNLLGYNKRLITGGSYGDAGFNGLLVYADPAILGSPFLGSLSLSLGRSEEEAVSLADEPIARWEAGYTRGQLRLGYAFTEDISLSTSLAYQQERFVADRRAPGAGEREKAIYHGGTLSVSRRDPQRYFDAGYSLEVEASYQIDTSTEREWWVATQLSRNILLFRDHRLRYALRAEESERRLWRTTRLGGRETQRTIDRQSVPTERFISGGVTYELPVYRPDWGTLTLLGFYEGGILAEAEHYHGPGAGFRLYLSRVTLPAVGFDLTYRGTEDLWLFSFSIGMSM
jgi:outer membrane protein assembly factor BamA